jgi:D-alanyl-D-alanine carboxypeptidase
LPESESLEDLTGRVLDDCVLVAVNDHQVIASAGIDLEESELKGLFLDSMLINSCLVSKMIAEIEKMAVSFGIFKLRVQSSTQDAHWLQNCGYRAKPVQRQTKPEQQQSSCLHRSFRRRQTKYSRLVTGILDELGIPLDYGRLHRMPLQQQAKTLKSIGTDIYGRPQNMLPRAADAWIAMSRSATQKEILLQPVSAFRSLSYQEGLLRRKIHKGQSIDQILSVSAAPGFSEHHTGRAIDVTTPGFPVLEKEFESSPAFEWLQIHAEEFGFRMSFPRDNRHEMAYEPWHWAWG